MNKNELVSQLAGTIQDETVVVDKKNYVGECQKCGGCFERSRQIKGDLWGRLRDLIWEKNEKRYVMIKVRP